ncbi:pentapeptide repeat-containing protein [Microvirga vignae]|uniref:pentapeptide repeat-containing protein n=1 Tax=Microvirga vignae TaxID=1225564 RepID=UPI003CC7A309
MRRQTRTTARSLLLLSVSCSSNPSTRPSLTGAGLSSANLTYADLREANLFSAKLDSADLSNADLRDATLTGAFVSAFSRQGWNGPPPGWKVYNDQGRACLRRSDAPPSEPTPQ